MVTPRVEDTAHEPSPPATPEPGGDTRVFVYDPTDPHRYGEVHRVGSLTLRSLLLQIQLGHPVAYIPLDKLFAVEQAADFLNLPLAAVRQAIAGGRLPTAGPHALHVRFSDLLVYRAELRAARRRAVEEVAEIDRELGLEG